MQKNVIKLSNKKYIRLFKFIKKDDDNVKTLFPFEKSKVKDYIKILI